MRRTDDGTGWTGRDDVGAAGDEPRRTTVETKGERWQPSTIHADDDTPSTTHAADEP